MWTRASGPDDVIYDDVPRENSDSNTGLQSCYFTFTSFPLLFFFSLYFVLVCTCSLSCSVNNRTYTTGVNKWSCLYVTLSHLCRSRWDDLWWCGGRRGGWLQQLTGQWLELQWVWKLWREQRRRGLPGKWRAPRFHETKATSEENPCMSNSRFLIPLTENNSSYVSMLHICMGVETAGTKEGFNFLLIVKVEEVFCLSHIIYIEILIAEYIQWVQLLSKKISVFKLMTMDSLFL